MYQNNNRKQQAIIAVQLNGNAKGVTISWIYGWLSTRSGQLQQVPVYEEAIYCEARFAGGKQG